MGSFKSKLKASFASSANRQQNLPATNILHTDESNQKGKVDAPIKLPETEKEIALLSTNEKVLTKALSLMEQGDSFDINEIAEVRRALVSCQRRLRDLNHCLLMKQGIYHEIHIYEKSVKKRCETVEEMRKVGKNEMINDLSTKMMVKPSLLLKKIDVIRKMIQTSEKIPETPPLVQGNTDGVPVPAPAHVN